MDDEELRKLYRQMEITTIQWEKSGGELIRIRELLPLPYPGDAAMNMVKEYEEAKRLESLSKGGTAQ